MNTAQTYAPQGSHATPDQPLAAQIPQTAKSIGQTPPFADNRLSPAYPVRPYQWQVDYLGYVALNKEASLTLFSILGQVRELAETVGVIPALSELLNFYLKHELSSRNAVERNHLQTVVKLMGLLSNFREDYDYLNDTSNVSVVLEENWDNCVEGGDNE